MATKQSLEEIIAGTRLIMTAGGLGTRMWPFGLVNPVTVLTKGLNRYMGMPLAEMQIKQVTDAGIFEVHVVSKDISNRQPLLNRLDSPGTHIYNAIVTPSHPMRDRYNQGSADAIISYLSRVSGYKYSLIMANDNYYGMHIPAVLDEHAKSGAVVSILYTEVPALTAINTYGLLLTDTTGKVIRFTEKPKNANELRGILGMPLQEEGFIDDLIGLTVKVNGAGYILSDEEVLRTQMQPWVIRCKLTNFDMGSHYIPGLVENGEHVHAIKLDDWLDFGQPNFFLKSVQQLLSGRVPFVFEMLRKNKYMYLEDGKFTNPLPGKIYPRTNHVWIHPETLRMDHDGRVYPDTVPGITLDERIKAGIVRLESDVFIGRGVIFDAITPDAVIIKEVNFDKFGYVGTGTEITSSYVGEEVYIGQNALVENTLISMSTEIESSSHSSPTVIQDYSILGTGTRVPPGTFLDFAYVWPGFLFPEEAGQIYKGDITSGNPYHLEPDDARKLEVWKNYTQQRNR
ncbi:NDP-sugar synthase [Candidatus Woesearchaeota archaeon]|nr:NDP-sugar synthase [Candidatus Woesearchaeota archaeon]